MNLLAHSPLPMACTLPDHDWQVSLLSYSELSGRYFLEISQYFSGLWNFCAASAYAGSVRATDGQNNQIGHFSVAVALRQIRARP